MALATDQSRKQCPLTNTMRNPLAKASFEEKCIQSTPQTYEDATYKYMQSAPLVGKSRVKMCGNGTRIIFPGHPTQRNASLNLCCAA